MGQRMVLMPAVLPGGKDWFVDCDDHNRPVLMPDHTKVVVVSGLATRERARYGIDGRDSVAEIQHHPPALVFETFSEGPAAVPLAELYGLEAVVDALPR